MVKVLKLLAYMLFFVLALVYFIPKDSVYYYAENQLKLHKIILSQEEIVENKFSLDINNAELLYSEIESAQVENINLKFFLVYNSINVENITLSEMANSFVPTQIQTLHVEYTIFNPLSVRLNAVGDFGEIDASFNILDTNATAILIPSKIMLQKYKKSLRYFKKNENGEYQYDKTF